MYELCKARKLRKTGVWVSGAEIQALAVDTGTAGFGYPPLRKCSESFWEKLRNFSRKLRGSQRQLCIKTRPLGCLSQSRLGPRSSAAATSRPNNTPQLPTGEDLSHRWQMQKPHLKIRAMCASRRFVWSVTAGASQTRPLVGFFGVCKTSLAGAYTLLPCQWPLVGVPPQVLQLCEGSKQATEIPVPIAIVAADFMAPAPDVAMAAPDNTANDSCGKISQVERNSQENVLAVEGTPLRSAMQDVLVSLFQELTNLRPAGQQLDQAFAKERSTRNARKHVKGLQVLIEAANRSLQNARAAEDWASAETIRTRAQLAQTEPMPQDPRFSCQPKGR